MVHWTFLSSIKGRSLHVRRREERVSRACRNGSVHASEAALAAAAAGAAGGPPASRTKRTRRASASRAENGERSRSSRPPHTTCGRSASAEAEAVRAAAARAVLMQTAARAGCARCPRALLLGSGPYPGHCSSSIPNAKQTNKEMLIKLI